MGTSCALQYSFKKQKNEFLLPRLQSVGTKITGYSLQILWFLSSESNVAVTLI